MGLAGPRGKTLTADGARAHLVADLRAQQKGPTPQPAPRAELLRVAVAVPPTPLRSARTPGCQVLDARSALGTTSPRAQGGAAVSGAVTGADDPGRLSGEVTRGLCLAQRGEEKHREL